MHNKDKDLEKRLAALEQELAKNQAAKPSRSPVSEYGRQVISWFKTNKWVSATIVGSLVLIAISLSFYVKLHKPAVQVPKLQQIADSAGFEVYFPGDLPPGFSFDPKSASFSSGVLIYTIAGPNGSTITVTEQKKPQNFDYHSIQTDTSFKTPYGTATAYEQSDKSMGSLVSDTTWVVCNSSKAIGAKAMEAVLQSMQTVQ